LFGARTPAEPKRISMISEVNLSVPGELPGLHLSLRSHPSLRMTGLAARPEKERMRP
jgi:hypothetical protein